MNEKSAKSKKRYLVLIIIHIVLILGSFYQLIISVKNDDVFGKFLYSISLSLWVISTSCYVMLFKKNSGKETSNKPYQQ